jgi:MFS family permease
MALQFAAGGAVMPFVTLLLRDRGLDFSHISQIFLCSSATLLVFPFLWGMLADRFVPLNRLFIALNLLACAALAGFATQTEFPGLLAAFTLFVACLNPMFSLINALSFYHLSNARDQFGLLRAWGSAGWIVPFLPISLWMLYVKQTRLDFVLYLSFAICLAMAVLSFWLPHTPPGARKNLAGNSLPGTYWPAIKQLLRDPNYLVLLASMFLVAGSYSLLTYYSPPFLEDMGVPRLWIGPIQSIGVISEIIFFQWQPRLIRRWNYTAIILIGCIALLIRHLIFGITNSAWILSFSYPLAGAVIVFYHMGVSVLVNAIAASEVRSTAQTLLIFFGSGLGPMFANWIAGRLTAQSANSLRPVFLFAAALAALAIMLIALRGRRLNQVSEVRPATQ